MSTAEPAKNAATTVSTRVRVRSQPKRRAMPAHTPAMTRPWRGRVRDADALLMRPWWRVGRCRGIRKTPDLVARYPETAADARVGSTRPRGGRRMAELTDTDRVAVYIDFDNIVISRYDQLHGDGAWRKDKARDAK